MLRVIGVVRAAGWFACALLHLLLLVGLPLGALTLGGRYTVLPLTIRPVSLVMVVLWSLCGWISLAYAGVVPSRVPHRRLHLYVALMAVWLLAASVFNLFITASSAERYGTGALTVVILLLTVILLVIGRSSAGGRPGPQPLHRRVRR